MIVLPYKALIFDMDGVIIDSERIAKRIWIEVGQKYGVSKKKMYEMFDRCLGMNVTDERAEFSERCGWSSDDYDNFIEEVRAEKDHHRSIAGSLPLKDGVRELLDTLSEGGYKIALASSSTAKNIDRNLSGNKIKEYFDVILSGDDVLHAKPNPEIYTKTAEQLEVSAAECLVIEDAPNGIKAAGLAGMSAIMVEDTIKAPSILPKNVLFKVDDLFQIEAYIRKFNRR